jgi:hypothetical protein
MCVCDGNRIAADDSVDAVHRAAQRHRLPSASSARLTPEPPVPLAPAPEHLNIVRTSRYRLGIHEHPVFTEPAHEVGVEKGSVALAAHTAVMMNTQPLTNAPPSGADRIFHHRPDCRSATSH